MADPQWGSLLLYDPISGDLFEREPKYRPRTCFIATQLGSPSRQLKLARKNLEAALEKHGFSTIDAGETVTGRDFLLKIVDLIVECPVVIALVADRFSHSTLANIFYELGLAQALGKETLVVKTPRGVNPTDLVRTEYIKTGRGLDQRIEKFIHNLTMRAEYYAKMSRQLREDPSVAQDYARRAFLLTGKVGASKPGE